MSSSPPHRRLLLLRHGHYLRDGRTSDPAYRLSPLGRRQAVRLGRHLRALLASYDGSFEGIYTSPWARARETAEIVGHETGVSTLRIKPYLHETIPLPPAGDPPLPGHVRRAVVHQVERVRGRFFRPPSRNELVFVATHGNLIRYLVASILGLPFEAWVKLDIAHASITEVRIYEGGLDTLFAYAETAHLPAPMVTTS